MPSLRRIAGRLVSTLPAHREAQVRRLVRAGRRRNGPAEPIVTYVVSPHPDDETLRLAGYVRRRYERTHGRLVLVAITDGGASGQARKKGWSPEYEREYRRAEQAAAWSAVTGGTGEIIRVGLSDNAVTAEDVRDALAPLSTPRARFCIAAHPEDYHRDHRAVVAGVRLLDPAHVRFSLSPLMTGDAQVSRPKGQAADAVKIAVDAYQGFGHISVPAEFRALVRSGYRSRLTTGSAESDVIQRPPAQRRQTEREGTPRDAQTPQAPPVFVLGNQKSGSTAIAALLAECVGQTFLSDPLYRDKVNLKDLLADEALFARLLRDHAGSFGAAVVKDNDFTFLYRSVAREFPEARFAFVVRDPRQNIRSVLNRLKLPGDLDALSPEQYDHLSTKLPGWHSIVTGSSFGTSGGHYIDVLADRWVRANQVYLDAGDRLVLVRYEDFDAAKRPAVERLAAQLELPVVKDISALQDHQYQPRGDRSIGPRAFFGQANLERIERRCATLMDVYGYAPTEVGQG
jgi:LmbE family N-acetylglucosaminyl deacetylase